MLNTVSWGNYWLFVVTSTSIYYLVVYFLYFKGDLLKRGIFSSAMKEKTDLPSFHQPMSASSTNDEIVVDACINELNAFFENQKKSKAVKHELMHGLYSILQKYPSLRHSDLRDPVSSIIRTQSETICSIHLSAEELKGVWLG